MKRTHLYLLCLAMLLTLTACGDTSQPTTDDQPPTNTDAIEPAEPIEETTPEPEEPADTLTMGQKNALGSAESYLEIMPFSHSGLIGQLKYDGYTTEEATYAADNCGADWNEQAAKSAENYLELMSFSRQELIDQLVYDGFTQEQAEYGVTAAGY